jgi:hypothetical protein
MSIAACNARRERQSHDEEGRSFHEAQRRRSDGARPRAISCNGLLDCSAPTPLQYKCGDERDSEQPEALELMKADIDEVTPRYHLPITQQSQWLQWFTQLKDLRESCAKCPC